MCRRLFSCLSKLLGPGPHSISSKTYFNLTGLIQTDDTAISFAIYYTSLVRTPWLKTYSESTRENETRCKMT